MTNSGMILISKGEDAPVIMGISKPAGLKSPHGEVKIVNPLFVGIDVSSKNNVAYLMKPDGSKHSNFSVQNNLGGAKLLSERIVSALRSMQLSDVVIGLEATSIYGDSLVYALREDGSLGRFQRKIHVLNPKQVRKFKEAYSDLPKNDWVDASQIPLPTPPGESGRSYKNSMLPCPLPEPRRLCARAVSKHSVSLA